LFSHKTHQKKDQEQELETHHHVDCWYLSYLCIHSAAWALTLLMPSRMVPHWSRELWALWWQHIEHSRPLSCHLALSSNPLIMGYEGGDLLLTGAAWPMVGRCPSLCVLDLGVAEF